MKAAAEKIIRESVQGGETMESIRNKLISNGFGTEGFDEAYKAAVVELGVQEKHEAVHEGSIHAGIELDPNRPHDMGDVIREKEAVKKNFSRVHTLVTVGTGFVILLLIFGGLFMRDMISSFLGSIVSDEEERMSPGDVRLVIEADRYQIAAEAYKSKIFSYDGLCRSIGLDQDSFSCTENIETYAIDTQLETGGFYCVDSTGFADLANGARKGKLTCRE